MGLVSQERVAFAPFEKGGGDRAADAGDLLLLLLFVEGKSKSPLTPIFQKGDFDVVTDVALAPGTMK
ncbi:hypothetical protein [Lysobacter capsici]|uniref:hypothetical protein n=1 Tax=Lysobacter capsici TaxID=435897 RepID=UPI00287B9260|nr:hypothetical protein [Lysobacter capsici]WND78196.1 hypothetical protein RJ610_12805 [Lysobacter capsici]WND83390.1 hypothetical protein RJ609_12815 [Lysobacter capsici]